MDQLECHPVGVGEGEQREGIGSVMSLTVPRWNLQRQPQDQSPERLRRTHRVGATSPAERSAAVVSRRREAPVHRPAPATLDVVHHLAEVNVARLLAPLDDPSMRDFVAAVGPVERLAAASPGLVWRLADEGGHGVCVQPDDGGPVFVNLTLWRDTTRCTRSPIGARTPTTSNAGRAGSRPPRNRPRRCGGSAGTVRPSTRPCDGCGCCAPTGRHPRRSPCDAGSTPGRPGAVLPRTGISNRRRTRTGASTDVLMTDIAVWCRSGLELGEQEAHLLLVADPFSQQVASSILGAHELEHRPLVRSQRVADHLRLRAVVVGDNGRRCGGDVFGAVVSALSCSSPAIVDRRGGSETTTQALLVERHRAAPKPGPPTSFPLRPPTVSRSEGRPGTTCDMFSALPASAEVWPSEPSSVGRWEARWASRRVRPTSGRARRSGF